MLRCWAKRAVELMFLLMLAACSGSSGVDQNASTAATSGMRSASFAAADAEPAFVTSSYQSDLGDGTFRNPVLYADAPDPSAIKVGDYYYLATSSFQLMPGIPILQSTDLVNWTLVSYVYDSMGSDISGFDASHTDAYNLQNGRNVYGQGSWANSLKFHNQTFYSVFSSLDMGATMVCSHAAELGFGNWSCSKIAGIGYAHDPDLFFDDDGSAYLFAGNCYLTQLAPDLKSVKVGGINQRIFDGGDSHDGNRVIKRNGFYYVLATPQAGGTRPGWERVEVAWRSRSLTGNWESKVILDDVPNHQAAIVDDGAFQWAVLFADAGAIGRIPKLTPVTWVDDWPILGVNGKVQDSLTKPVAGATLATPESSDFFTDTNAIGHQWQWNHNPDNSKWSLTERSGWLRLKTSPATSLYDARNTLTQRGQGPQSVGWVKLDASQLRSGQLAGLAAFHAKFGYIGVRNVDGTKYLVQSSVGNSADSTVALSSDTVYLKLNFDFSTDTAAFSYSYDEQHWTQLGQPLSMEYYYTAALNNYGLWYVGYRFALFNYTTGSDTSGYADFDFFKFSNTTQ